MCTFRWRRSESGTTTSAAIASVAVNASAVSFCCERTNGDGRVVVYVRA
jgi:hypothetical protein